MPTDYLKMAQECYSEAAAKEARIKERGRGEARRRIALLKELRDELLINARFYERRAGKENQTKE